MMINTSPEKKVGVENPINARVVIPRSIQVFCRRAATMPRGNANPTLTR
jgi:hypothetical protein